MANSIKHKPESIAPLHNHKTSNIGVGLSGHNPFKRKDGLASSKKGPYLGDDKSMWTPWKFAKSDYAELLAFLLLALVVGVAFAVWMLNT